LIITNAKQTETGDWTFDIHLANEEVESLVNLSVQTLIREGVISLTEQDEQQEIILPYQNAPSSATVN